MQIHLWSNADDMFNLNQPNCHSSSDSAEPNGSTGIPGIHWSHWYAAVEFLSLEIYTVEQGVWCKPLFFCRFCGDDLPDDIISTGEKLKVSNMIVDSLPVSHWLFWHIWFFPGNVMTLKFLSDSSVTAGGFRLTYTAIQSKNFTTYNWWIIWLDTLIYSCVIRL